MRIRKATRGDVGEILRVFDDARDYQRASGFIQWADGYPNHVNICEDIDKDSAYVLEMDENIAGYFFIAYDDVGYSGLKGMWENDGKFGVIHRLAVDGKYRGLGLGILMIREAERLAFGNGARSMRVDTGEANFIMQRIMASSGYKSKGLLEFPWGPRLAYEKGMAEY